MNPSGMRIEEKKSADASVLSYNNDERSLSSYKSTQSSRSSVLQRAREYNRRIDEQNKRRSKSLERSASTSEADSYVSGMSGNNRRSVSAGRQVIPTSRVSTRERAMASVRKETTATSHVSPVKNTNKIEAARRMYIDDDSCGTSDGPSPRAKAASTRPTAVVPPAARTVMEPYNRTSTPTTATTTSSSSPKPPQSYQQPSPIRQHQAVASPIQQPVSQPRGGNNNITPTNTRPRANMTRNTTTSSSRTLPITNLTSNASPGSQSTRSRQSRYSDQQSPNAQPHQQAKEQHQPAQEANAADNPNGVSPELLVDALAGHEDGLLAIAERLMESYDGGYDVMGEAIIDAFADVQRLFQHVVEAAHMEGAAFEATRREEEVNELKKQLASSNIVGQDGVGEYGMPSKTANSPGSQRLDEFVDQDVKDMLTEAIRKGTQLRDANKHRECLDLYERACINASSLLPVDSDNRGRLHMSMSRAESLSPDRACAILRYTMDDVLRSGLKPTKSPMPDLSKRSDLVLNRPTNSMVSNGGHYAGALQSADEALNSLIEEMKEILSAPVYEDTPLQHVAQRFWVALHDAQKLQHRNEDRLEQQLAKLKGEFLLAKSEWEEKLSKANEQTELYKSKVDKLRKDAMKGEKYMDQARQFAARLNDSDMDMSTIYGSVKSGTSGRANSVASLGSGLAQQAKTIVNSVNSSFNCANLNERSGQNAHDLNGDDALDIPFDRSRSMERTSDTTGTSERSRTPAQTRTPGTKDRSRTPVATRTPATSKAYQDYSRSPQRIDV
ncbi:hypothetical protein MPSEU_001090400 [Mayamaea pseudoterrestris]|nr:hypothetical protein MPSEU_001090400 [Mayamaea pseudoterrestris]